MTTQNDAGAMFDRVLNGGKGSPYSLIARNLFPAGVQRYVEVCADKDRFVSRSRSRIDILAM